MRVAAGILLVSGALLAQAPEECRSLYRHGKLTEARGCYLALSRSANLYYRAEGLWGVRLYKAANDAFRDAVAARPKDPEIRVRWGRLYLEHNQPGDAAILFQEALEIQPGYAPALLGTALAASEHFESKAVQLAEMALKSDAKLVEARELLAWLALEDSDRKKAEAESDKALALSPEALDAMAVRASIDWLDDRADSEWASRIAKIDPAYGEAYATGAHFLVLNRRYEDGIRLYRKALELNPDLWPARAELGIQLMRMGDEAGARKELEACYAAGYYSNAVTNSLKLLDSYKRYETFRTPTTILRLDRKEADLLRLYFQAELDRALGTYEKKYKLKLTRPVQVEVYPDHEDFAVRTMGMPGLGALGVTFGTVVAMDSPSGRPPGSFHWASTLWHELSHVYVLAATNHRVPRWFTEGMAVYEETAVSPEWGDRLDFEAIRAIQQNKLLPVSELDRGFVRPQYPSQVTVSYFQAGRICEYIQSKWGYDKLLAMMHDFAARKDTPEVIEQELGMKAEQFDAQFRAWLRDQTKTQVTSFDIWKKRLGEIAKAAEDKRWDYVISEGNMIRDMYPDYVEHGSVYELLADAYAATNAKDKAAADLERYACAGGRSPALLKRLAEMQSDAGRKKDAVATLSRLNFIAPVDEQLHRMLGGLLMETGDSQRAVREWQAVVAMKTIDPAGANFELAKAFRASGKKDDAREAVLNSLEAAPGYKPAQRLLLELDGKD